MSGARRIAVAWVVALVAPGGIASGQPLTQRLPDPLADPQSAGSDARPRDPAGNPPKIPITMRPGEILGGDAPAADLLAPPPPPLSLEHSIDPDSYVSGPSDMFELDVWGPQNFELKLTADLEGRLFIPRVGFLPVAGKTLSAVRAAMKSKVRAVYPGLSFDLRLVSPRSFVVHVVDNVKQPGAYISRALDRVSTVIARAGVTT